jgi:hypothetical protein
MQFNSISRLVSGDSSNREESVNESEIEKACDDA